MSEYRRDDTASWDTREVRRAQSGQHAAPTERPRSRPRRRRRNPFLGFVGYVVFVALASALLAGAGWMLGSDFCAFNRGTMTKATVEVTAHVTPSKQALTGDYVVTMSAGSSQVSDSAEFRVAVKTSMVWGVVAVAVIAALLAGIGSMFRRYGRR